MAFIFLPLCSQFVANRSENAVTERPVTYTAPATEPADEDEFSVTVKATLPKDVTAKIKYVSADSVSTPNGALDAKLTVKEGNQPKVTLTGLVGGATPVVYQITRTTTTSEGTKTESSTLSVNAAGAVTDTGSLLTLGAINEADVVVEYTVALPGDVKVTVKGFVGKFTEVSDTAFTASSAAEAADWKKGETAADLVFYSQNGKTVTVTDSTAAAPYVIAAGAIYAVEGVEYTNSGRNLAFVIPAGVTEFEIDASKIVSGAFALRAEKATIASVTGTTSGEALAEVEMPGDTTYKWYTVPSDGNVTVAYSATEGSTVVTIDESTGALADTAWDLTNKSSATTTKTNKTVAITSVAAGNKLALVGATEIAITDEVKYTNAAVKTAAAGWDGGTYGEASDYKTVRVGTAFALTPATEGQHVIKASTAATSEDKNGVYAYTGKDVSSITAGTEKLFIRAAIQVTWSDTKITEVRVGASVANAKGDTATDYTKISSGAYIVPGSSTGVYALTDDAEGTIAVIAKPADGKYVEDAAGVNKFNAKNQNNVAAADASMQAGAADLELVTATVVVLAENITAKTTEGRDIGTTSKKVYLFIDGTALTLKGAAGTGGQYVKVTTSALESGAVKAATIKNVDSSVGSDTTNPPTGTFTLTTDYVRVEFTQA